MNPTGLSLAARLLLSPLAIFRCALIAFVGAAVLLAGGCATGESGAPAPNESGGANEGDGADAVGLAGCTQRVFADGGEGGEASRELLDEPSLAGEVIERVPPDTLLRVQAIERDGEPLDGEQVASATWLLVETGTSSGWVPEQQTQCAADTDPVGEQRSGWTWPTPGFNGISFGFNAAVDYGCQWHTGVDVLAWAGSDILAPQAGTVVHVGELWDFNLRGPYSIIIDHGGGTYTTYAHNNTATVAVGDWVNRGDKIGTVGALGYVTGAHLHFEILEGAAYTWNWEWPFYGNPCLQYRNPLNYF